MHRRVDGKNIVVTAGSRRIGRAFAERFVAEGVGYGAHSSG